MIIINNSKDCTGCFACAEKCPLKCVSRKDDEEGFLYPIFDTTQCIECGICEKVCPTINFQEKNLPLLTYGLQNKDTDILLNSSSGGVFYNLALETLKEQGVVFGVILDKDMHARHVSCTKETVLHKLMGSKYMQSDVGNTYSECKTYLDKGIKVLYSGVGCQIAGLRSYLGKEYPNLLLVEVACHGVPSPKVFSTYIRHSYNYKEIKDFNFRDKQFGWENYNLKITLKNNSIIVYPAKEDLFMRAFLSDLILRPSCYDCKFKYLRSGADILLGDLWGVNYLAPNFNNNKGASLCCLNTQKGLERFSLIKNNFYIKEIDFINASKFNPCLVDEVLPHPRRKFFFKNLDRTSDINTLIQTTFQESFIQKTKNRLNNTIRKIRKLKNLS